MTVEKKKTDSRASKIIVFIIALLGAFLLWIYAMGYDTEITTQIFSGVPVELTGTNVNGYTVAEENFTLSIDVTASGTRSALNDVTAADFRAYVDISNVSGAGYNTLPISVVEPNALNVTGLSTSHVTLYIDTFTRKSVPILVEYTISSADSVGKVERNLENVSVYGPETLLRNAEAFMSLELGNVTSPEVTVSGRLQLRDAETKAVITNPYITYSSQTAEVTFTMFRRMNLPLRLKTTGGMLNADDLQYAFTGADIAVYGPVRELQNLNELSFSVDETKVKSGSSVVKTAEEILRENHLSADTTAETPKQEITCTVNIPETKTASVHVAATKIQTKNLPAHGNVTIVSSLDITLLGSPAAVKAYADANLTVTVDCSKLSLQESSGLYVTDAIIETGDSNICVYGGPYQVTLNVDAGH